jgi:hypothetical protein
VSQNPIKEVTPPFNRFSCQTIPRLPSPNSSRRKAGRYGSTTSALGPLSASVRPVLRLPLPDALYHWASRATPTLQSSWRREPAATYRHWSAAAGAKWLGQEWLGAIVRLSANSQGRIFLLTSRATIQRVGGIGVPRLLGVPSSCFAFAKSSSALDFSPFL